MDEQTWTIQDALDDARTHRRGERYLVQQSGTLKVYAAIEYDPAMEDAWFFGYEDAGRNSPQAELTEHTEEMSGEIEDLYSAYREAGGGDFEQMLEASGASYIALASSNQMGWAGVYFFDEESVAAGVQRHLEHQRR
ncbi:MAG: hypothetical protein HKN04_11970 [Rhodothermaceae bacterium]|nr:hypothetical protein [Rhodothermaceae bacterium]